MKIEIPDVEPAIAQVRKMNKLFEQLRQQLVAAARAIKMPSLPEFTRQEVPDEHEQS